MPGRGTRGGAQLDKKIYGFQEAMEMFAVRRIRASDEERGAARAQAAPTKAGANPRVMAWPAVVSGLFKPAAPHPFSQARPRAPRLPCNCSTQLPWIWRAEDSAPPARFSGKGS